MQDPEQDKADVDNFAEQIGRKGRPKGSKNKRKRGRPKAKKKYAYKPKKKEPDLSNVQLPELPVIKNYKQKQNIVIPETLEAIPVPEKLAPKTSHEAVLDSLLDDEKLKEENPHKQKEINQEPVDPSYYYRGSKNIPVAGAEYAFTADMVEELRKCQEDIVYFAENFFHIVTLDKRGKSKIKLYEAQKKMLLNMVNQRFTANLSCRQSGKALALDTPIRTTKGWKTMGELTTKDKVYGSNGTPINITHVHEVLENRECYKVTFDNGEEIIADAEHQWFTRNSKGEEAVRTTLAIHNTVDDIHTIPACRAIDHMRLIHAGELHVIKSIEKCASVPVRCITVKSPDSLYLAGKSLIPTHNSTLLTIFVLWSTCFNDDYRAAIVANKEATAVNIFKRIRLAYEQLPNYIKPGVKDYAKTGMTLGNDSSIIVSTTTATSIRGDTLNCICLDEAAFIECLHDETTIQIRNKHTKEIKTLTIKEAIGLFESQKETLP